MEYRGVARGNSLGVGIVLYPVCGGDDKNLSMYKTA